MHRAHWTPATPPEAQKGEDEDKEEEGDDEDDEEEEESEFDEARPAEDTLEAVTKAQSVIRFSLP